MVLKENIKRLRKFHSMTQQDLADAIGIKRANIGAYEEGRCEPGIYVISAIAKRFNVKIDDLVNKEMYVESEVRFKEVL